MLTQDPVRHRERKQGETAQQCASASVGMMKDEEYAQFPELIPEPETQETEEGRTVISGMSYGDVALLITQFKSALTRYFQKKR